MSTASGLAGVASQSILPVTEMAIRFSSPISAFPVKADNASSLHSGACTCPKHQGPPKAGLTACDTLAVGLHDNLIPVDCVRRSISMHIMIADINTVIQMRKWRAAFKDQLLHIRISEIVAWS